MEVHHHPHAEKKTWKQYFWEFLMLFLAVFCGFLAENARENLVERKREKEYISSLVKDLEYDTAQFNYHNALLKKKMPFIDSAFSFLQNPSKFNYKLPQRIWVKVIDEEFYKPVEPTIQQLKNSGNLRLIENKKVLDSILVYDSWIVGPYNEQVSSVLDLQKKLLEFSERMFDEQNFKQLFDNGIPVDLFTDTTHTVTLASKDAAQLRELYNKILDFKLSNLGLSEWLDVSETKAANLITLIKKEYHLE